jgi:hypothetical protein
MIARTAKNCRTILNDTSRRYSVEVTMLREEWGQKRERQYEHIKKSEEEREGRSEETAKRIAAATVNKTRREKGETKEQKKK